MNKFCLICASAVCLSLFTSCNKSEFENHDLGIEYPDNNIGFLFADQVEDSLVFHTFDSYKASPLQSPWITITAGASYDVDYNPYNVYYFKTLLAFTPNTTGRTRYGYVRIDSYDKSIAAVYAQFGFLNINHPVPTYTDVTSMIPDSAAFLLPVAADAQADSICFTVSQPWTLRLKNDADQSWITLGSTSGQAGHHNIALSLARNTGGANPRTASLILKSGQVENEIDIRQLPVSQGNNQ